MASSPIAGARFPRETRARATSTPTDETRACAPVRASSTVMAPVERGGESNPPSLEALVGARREAANAVVRPTFVSKEDRAKAAIARREAEVAAQRARAEEARKAAAPPAAAAVERGDARAESVRAVARRTRRRRKVRWVRQEAPW